jgi:hypothetical protein
MNFRQIHTPLWTFPEFQCVHVLQSEYLYYPDIILHLWQTARTHGSRAVSDPRKVQFIPRFYPNISIADCGLVGCDAMRSCRCSSYKRLGAMHRPYLQSEDKMGVTTQKTTIDNFTALRIWNLMKTVHYKFLLSLWRFFLLLLSRSIQYIYLILDRFCWKVKYRTSRLFPTVKLN